MTLQNWDLEDWLVEFPDTQYKGKRINAPVKLKIGQVTKFIIENIIPDAIKSLKNGGELSSLLLCLALIDYMAGYFVGGRSGEKAYIKFMSRYFPQKYDPYLKSIYGQLRCGLIHSLVSSNPHFKGERVRYIISGVAQEQLEKRENNQLLFSIPVFIEDTQRACIMYIYDMIMKEKDNPELIINFNLRYNKLDGESSVMVKTPD